MHKSRSIRTVRATQIPCDRRDYGDMIKKGIVDPTKVTRSALQNAASIASMVLTTDALVADKKEDAAAANAAAAASMGGMGGGMY